MQKQVVVFITLLLASQVHAATTEKLDVSDAMKEASVGQRESYKKVHKILYGTEVTSGNDVSTEKSTETPGFKIRLNRL